MRQARLKGTSGSGNIKTEPRESRKHERIMMKSIRNEREVRKREIEHKKKIVAAQVRPCVERGGEREKHKTVKRKKKTKKEKEKKGPGAHEDGKPGGGE